MIKNEDGTYTITVRQVVKDPEYDWSDDERDQEEL